MRKIYGFYKNRFYFSEDDKLKYVDSDSNIHIKENSLDEVYHIWNGKDYNLVVKNRVLADILLPQNWNVCFKDYLSKIKNQSDLLNIVKKYKLDLVSLEVDNKQYYVFNIESKPIIMNSEFMFENVEIFFSNSHKYLKINNKIKKCNDTYIYQGREVMENIDLSLDYKIKTYKQEFYDYEQYNLSHLLEVNNKYILTNLHGKYIALNQMDVVYNLYNDRYIIKTMTNKFYLVDFLQNTITESKLEKLDNLIELDDNMNPKSYTYTLYQGCKQKKDYIHYVDFLSHKSYLYKLENNKLTHLNLVAYDYDYILKHTVKNNSGEYYLIDDNENILGTIW